MLGFKFLGRGLATMALVGLGIGNIGLVFSALILALIINLKLEKQLLTYAILNFVLIGSIVLFGF